ncbi:MAG: hypothetical protein GF333_06660 [Candidatus Omnitrophica bacterium]|nr:hypothetical protein [Candidatus Omnitrophota bacterium]
MRIIIIAQEEPVYFGPLVRGVIRALPEEVVLVVIAGTRGAGDHPKSLLGCLKTLYILWLIMEPFGFCRNAAIRLRQRILRGMGPFGQRYDQRGIASAAREKNIPVVDERDVNAPEFIEWLKSFEPDLIFNQSEILLKAPLLAVSRRGVINRHASLLPHFRGRLASFWAHAHQPPEYGQTVHFIAPEIDAGPFIVRKRFNFDPRLSYTRVLDLLFARAVPMICEAVEKLRDPRFTPMPNTYSGTRVYPFPSLDDARAYRRILGERRRGGAV